MSARLKKLGKMRDNDVHELTCRLVYEEPT